MTSLLCSTCFEITSQTVLFELICLLKSIDRILNTAPLRETHLNVNDEVVRPS